jgi:hypothetical protein
MIAIDKSSDVIVPGIAELTVLAPPGRAGISFVSFAAL